MLLKHFTIVFQLFFSEFPENAHLSKLVCFFCDKEFPGIQVLHSHQKECALASNSQKILTDTKNSIGKKRSFLHYLNLIPKVNADHVRSEKRRDVFLDVIVIDDDSDDENKDTTKDKSQRYLLSPNSLESKTKQNGKFRSKNKNCGLALNNAFAKTSSKVFKFDISSPLGMRLRYHCKQVGNCRLPISKICIANYEQYCSMLTTRIPHSNKCYHVTYRKSRQPSKFCHKYKFTRTQLRESCRARGSGLSLSSLRLKRQMKPCRISVEKLNLPCDDMSRGTFDAKKYMKMLNLKSDVDSFTKVSDEEVAMITETQTVVDAHEPSSALRPNGFVNIFGGLPASESHRLGDDKMRNSLERPVKRIGAYQTFRLRKPDARCKTVDVFSPGGDSYPGLVGWVNKHVEHPRTFARNVEFVPLTALYKQSLFEIENHDPQTRMFEISSVYSLAKSQDNAKSLSSDLPEKQHSSESIATLAESFPPWKIPSSATSTDVITIVDHDNTPLKACEQSQATETQSTRHGLLASATDVIDLTENVSSSLPGSSNASATISQQTVVESSNRNPSEVLRDILQRVSEQLCNQLSDKSQKSTDAHKSPPAEKSSGQQISYLQKELEQPIVIEIPDEDSAVFTKQQRNHATQSHSNSSNNNNNNASATTNNNLGNSDKSTALPSQRLPDKSSHSVPLKWHSVQPTVPARGQNGVQTNDTIDLSFDSDSEALDKESVATGQKRPLLSNSDSCPPRKRERPGVSLEHSSLPPLTFKCHICGCFFNFDNNSGTMIRNHYLKHNVTNIELVKQVLPGGQTTWSLVELNSVGQSTHSKPSGPATSTSVLHTSVSPNRVGIEVPLTRPSATPSFSPPVVSSLRPAVRQSNALPEFVSLEESCIPETFCSNPDVSSAKKRSSPAITTRLNSEKNCNMLPARHMQSAHAASRVADLNKAKSISSTINDIVLPQTGRQERNDVRFQKQTIDAKTLRAIHLAQLRPDVPSSTHVLAGSVPRATAASADQRQQIYFPTSANLNRTLGDRDRGDSNVGNQVQTKHSSLVSIQSNNNIVHGVICLD